MIIKSSTSLRNDYLTISNLAHDSKEPIFISKNGEGDLVVMSIDAFEKRDELIRLNAKLEAAERSRLAGEKTFSIDDSRDELEKIYDEE